MNSSRTLAGWLHFQQQLHPASIELELTRVRAVAERLALLPVTVPVAIVGGTNGKGSTATHLACLLKATGRRTGLFTSPHLRRYNERIRIDNVPVSDDELLAAFDEIEAVRRDVSLTYFEFNTLAALLLFRMRAVQAMVLEVGLGGRLDATNIVDADVAVVCSVSFDHTDWLGHTLEGIGREKAGIFRAGRPVVLGEATMPDSVFEAARSLRCPLSVAQRRYRWQAPTGSLWDYADESGSLHGLPAPTLGGDIQFRNAATAIAALRLLLPTEPAARDVAVIAAGLSDVQLEGRLQRVGREPPWLLDVAHNPAAAAVLAATLRSQPVPGRTIAVFGMLADKDVAAVVAALHDVVDHWCLCDVDDPRGLSGAQLRARMGAAAGDSEECGSVEAACTRAAGQASATDRIAVCGSFHVVGPALDYLQAIIATWNNESKSD